MLCLLDSNGIYNMALKISREIGYSYEVLPIFCALVKLANRDETAVLQALQQGEYNIQLNYFFNYEINKTFSFVQDIK